MRTLGCALAIVTALSAIARAEEAPAWCSDDRVDRFQYLRRLSLDLRQRAPTLAEYRSLEALDEVPASLVREFLDGPEFRHTVRAYHRDLLWPNLRNALMFNGITQLTEADGPGGRMYVLQDERSITYRGQPGGKACADRPQVEFAPDGSPVPGPDGLDGWVMVEPYWAPGTQVKVCAYEAQANVTVNDVIGGDAIEVPCYATGGYVSRRCGCGPNLAFCNFGRTRGLTRDSFVEQLLRLVDSVVLPDRPYADLLLTQEMEVNGPVSHYLRWQWGFAADVFMLPDAPFSVPDVPGIPALAYTDRGTWVKTERGARHAGVLTLPAYLLKFQTNRSRAHRFHNAFLCQPFQSPPGGLQLEPSDEIDVAKRPGCSYCHQTLEPAAAYWGRFAEQGATSLDPARFPVVNEKCRARAWKNDPLLRSACLRAYISEREPLGVLRAFEFARDGSPEAEQLARHADLGPRGFAERAIEDGRFARCTVVRWWKHLLRRGPTEAELHTIVPQLAEAFAANDHRLKSLIEALVTTDAYRRAP